MCLIRIDTPLRGDRSERREGEIEEVERSDCRRAELVMSGFMAGETAAGGGRIDGPTALRYLGLARASSPDCTPSTHRLL
ncbi:hypothetical protein NQZ68_012114 [Dissostichus eleginoides]|nr:hypothetical protein NQZ68_012114 [Dissostichus eleginoides]